MIRINLLPEEERVVERTPLTRFLVIVGGVTLCCLLVVAFAFTVKDRRSKQAEHDGLKKEIDALKVKTTEYDHYKSILADIKNRSDVVDKLKRTRILWSKKLLQFGQLMNKADYGWIDNLRVTAQSPDPSGTPQGFTWHMDCFTSGKDNFDNVSRFLRHVRGDVKQFGDIFQKDATDRTILKMQPGFSHEPFLVPEAAEGGGRRFFLEFFVNTLDLTDSAPK